MKYLLKTTQVALLQSLVHFGLVACEKNNWIVQSSYRRWDKKWWEYFTWTFGSDELKRKYMYQHSNVIYIQWPIDLLCSAISWRPVLVVEEAGVPGENHQPWASNW